MDERIKNKDCQDLIENLAYYIKLRGLKIESREDLDNAFKGYLKKQEQSNKRILEMPIEELKQNLGFYESEIYQNGKMILRGEKVFIENMFHALIEDRVTKRVYTDYLEYLRMTKSNIGFEKGEVEFYINGNLIKKGIIK